MYDGIDVCPVPSEDIQEVDNPRYYYVFPNGMSAPHNSIQSATEKVEALLKKLEDPDRRDAFYGTGDYA